MITVQEFFNFSIDIDHSLTAHSIYWAVINQKLSFDDDVKKLQEISLDHETILQMKEQNILGIGKIKLYVMESTHKGWFAFYLAEHSLDVYRLHEERFRESGVKVTQADRLMLRLMKFAETGEEMILYECRKGVKVYPAYVGHVMAGDEVFYWW
ncbi:hypothetical protein [Sporosarcina obsidiansis]|uniref:hypothetical protein n=1 Tax=Sporosarcina obsidiansis TaxID=2660748 RepID=UPI00129ABB60|nr:hypothetical protein [Sporosarcina obsidiansis]